MLAEKWTEGNIPDQSGRVCVVTGANTGLGFETARALAEHGASVVLAVRSPDKGAHAVARIRAGAPDADVRVQHLDLCSLDSIRATAQELRASVDRIDLLINNAGVMYTPRLQTADGFELQFGTNHFGHFALTGLLLDLLLGAEGSRIVTVSSIGHRIRAEIDFGDLHARRSYNRVAAYGRSKLANLLFTYELQRRLARAGAPTTALAAHPGASLTELGRHIRFHRQLQPLVRWMTQPAAMGALPILRAATDPGATGGQHYGPGGVREMRGHPVVVASNSRSHDPDLQQRLWEASEQSTGITYPLPDAPGAVSRH